MKTFREAIREQEMTVTVELPLRPSTTAVDLRETLSVLRPVVDAVQLGDNRYQLVHMSPLAAAKIALDNGVDAIMQLGCRDRNRIALQADLLGASALGVSTLILARGDKVPDDTPVPAKGVFDTRAGQLIALAGARQEFRLGAFVTAFDPAQDWDAVRIEEKLDGGVSFLQTQPCLNAPLLRGYVEKLVERKILQRASLIVEVPLLTSAAEARLLKDVAKGAPIPDAVVQRIAAASDPVREGTAVCAEMLVELKTLPGVSGINIHYLRDAQDVVAALQQAGYV